MKINKNLLIGIFAVVLLICSMVVFAEETEKKYELPPPPEGKKREETHSSSSQEVNVNGAPVIKVGGQTVPQKHKDYYWDKNGKVRKDASFDPETGIWTSYKGKYRYGSKGEIIDLSNRIIQIWDITQGEAGGYLNKLEL